MRLWRIYRCYFGTNGTPLLEPVVSRSQAGCVVADEVCLGVDQEVENPPSAVFGFSQLMTQADLGSSHGKLAIEPDRVLDDLGRKAVY